MVHVRGPRARRKLVAALLPVFLVGLLLLSVGGTPASSTHAGPAVSAISARAAAASPALAARATASPAPSPLSVGGVAKSVLVNYNASWPGNFLSSVDDLSVGPGAFVPSTGDLWLSDLPTAAVPGDLPRYAPVILFDPIANSFAGVVPQLTNTSDLVYDPANGFLYSADTLNDTVGVFNPATDNWAAPAIPVGSEPAALALDSQTGSLFVANYGSSNVTVIATSTNVVSVPSLATGPEPFGLAIDPTNQTLFIACANSLLLTVVNASTFAAVALPTYSLGGDPGGVAYSPSTYSLAVSVPTRSLVTVFNATNGATTALFTGTGSGIGRITALVSNSDFIVAVPAESDLILLDPQTDTVADASIPVGESPRSFDTDPADGNVYVWAEVSRNLSLVWSNGALASSSSPSLGPTPSVLAYDPGSGRLLVANSNDSTISFVSPASLASVAPPLQLGSAPLSLAADSADGVVYAGLESGLVTINASTASVVATSVAFTGATEALLIDAPDHILWALNSVSGLVGYDLPGLATTLTPGIGAGQDGIRTLAFDPTSDRLFLPVNTSGTSAIAVVDAATGAIINADAVSAPDLVSLAFDPADGAVYGLGENITIVNASTATLANVPLPIAPHVGTGTIVYDPSRQYLYASNWPAADTGLLTVIEGQTVDSSYAGETLMGVGHSPVALLPLDLPGGSPSAPSEIWVANMLSGTLGVVASSPPQIVSFAAVPATIEEGQNATFVLSYTGGAGAVQVSYAGLPSACASSNTTQFSCSPASPGSYEVTVTVLDGLGGSAEATTNLTVDSGIAIQVLAVSAEFPYVEQGTALAVALFASGGVAPYNYSWSFGDGTTGWGASISHLYPTIGTRPLEVNVTDQIGGKASMAWAIDVYAPLTITGSASTLSTDVDRPVIFTGVPAGGADGGTTVWSFGDLTLDSGNNVTHSWADPGAYNVTATYTDGLGDRVSWSTHVEVNRSPAGRFVVSAASAGNPAQTGTLFYYNATLFGGTAPFSVVWYFGDGSEAIGAHVTHAYSTAGNYSITANATDSVGGSVAASLLVQVVSAPPASNGSSLNFSLGALLGVVVGAAVAAVVVFVAGGRRRKGRTPPPPSPYVPPTHQPWKED